jgi:cytoskeletal protein RodZ
MTGWTRLRESRGITLEQIANATKISSRSLKAIEAGEFAKLPGGIYDTSYIRQYCRAIDFDEQVLLSAYFEAVEVNHQAPESDPSRPRISGLRPAAAPSGS